MQNRKVKITTLSLVLFNLTSWAFMAASGFAGWPLPDNFFATYMTGNAFISGAFVGGNMYEHKNAKGEIK